MDLLTVRSAVWLASLLGVGCFHRFFEGAAPLSLDSGVALDARPIIDGGDDCLGGCSGTTPYCDANSHLCVACRDGGDCSGSFGCSLEKHVCAPCLLHRECATSVCKLDGSCALLSELLIVDNSASCQTSAHPLADLPYCELADALPQLDLNHVILVVVGSERPYRALALAPSLTRTLLVGRDQAGRRARVSGLSVGPAAIAASVAIDNIDIVNAADDGFDCDVGSGKPLSVALTDVHIHDSKGWALVGRGCDLNFDRGLVGPHNQLGGLSLASSSFKLTNLAIFQNEGSALTVEQNRPSGELGFSTLVGNRGAISLMSGSPFSVSSSIVIQNGAGQLSGALQLSQVVVGKEDSGMLPGTVHATPVFTGSGYQLAMDDPANQGDTGCCIDKASSGPARDAFGNRRPRGASYDIGAHEAQ